VLSNSRITIIVYIAAGNDVGMPPLNNHKETVFEKLSCHLAIRQNVR